eukprot:tig00000944_g5957.t1
MIFTLANLIGCVVEVTVGSNFFAAGGASQAAAGATSEEGEAGAFHVFRGVLGVSGQKPLIIYSRDLLELRKLDETFESTMSHMHPQIPRDLKPWIAVQEAADAPQEINEYALYLGMDPVYDSDLLWIAERALVAPLPESWTEHSDEQGHVFYYCGLTDTSSWEHPLDTLHRNLYLRLREERRSSQSAVHPEESAGAVQRKAQSESVNSSTLVPQDVLDMAAYLHLDLASEQALFWIARAAVLAPLPRNWTEQVDEVSNATVYVNEKGEIFSRHPADEYYLKLIEKARTLSGRAGEAPRASWQVFADANLELYYHNFTTGESTAARPVVSGLEAELLAREEEQILGAAKHLEGGPEQLANAEENAQEAAPKEKGMTVQQASAQHEQLMPSKKKKKTKDKEKASKTPASPSAPTFPISAIQEKPSKTPASASDSTFPVLAISEKSSKTPASTSALTSSTSFLVSVLPAGSAVALSLAAVVNQGRICIALALLAVFLTAMRSKS